MTFAVAAILWSLAVLRWSVSRKHTAGRGVIVVSCLAAVAAAASIASDAVTALRLRDATPSDVNVAVIRHGGWWEIEYARGGVSFTTANELHVPAGRIVRVRWVGAPVPSIRGSLCVATNSGATAVYTGAARVSDARFVSLHPLLNRTLAVVVEPLPAFDRWFRHEAAPAHPSAAGTAMFTSAGCVYCHRVRGAVDEASQIAPDLTHFASRRTIAGVVPPNRGRLAGWIVDSRGLKESSTMPRNAVAPAVLDQLVAYVESLR